MMNFILPKKKSRYSESQYSAEEEPEYYEGNLRGRAFRPSVSLGDEYDAIRKSHSGYRRRQPSVDTFQSRADDTPYSGNRWSTYSERFRPSYEQEVMSQRALHARRRSRNLSTEESIALLKARELAAEARGREQAKQQGVTKIAGFILRGNGNYNAVENAGRSERAREHRRIIFRDQGYEDEEGMSRSKRRILERELAIREGRLSSTRSKAIEKSRLIALEMAEKDSLFSSGRTTVSGYKVRGYDYY